MNISKHIETLLKFNECVIVPDFGGFISNYKPASFNGTSGTYSPPGKEIIFNSKIKRNDGLLINHLVENENISYSEANLAIIHFVDQSIKKLTKGENIVLEGIGNLKLDKNGSFVFLPYTQLLLDSYGLKEFTYQPAKLSNPLPTYQARSAVRMMQHRGNTVKIAASIAIVIALSVVPVKNIKQSVHNSALDPFSVILSSQPVNNETKTEVVKIEDSIDKPAPYILIGGNFHLQENAKTFCAELQEKGHNPEIIQLGNGNFRVAIDSYNDYQTALNAMETYRSNHPGSMVWVSKR